MSVPCLFAASLLLTSLDADAQSAPPTLLRTVTGNSLVPLVKARGDRYELKTDSAGDPLILAYDQDLGHSYQIIFYDCTNNTDCRTVQFRAWFKHTQDIPISEMNEWNRTKRLGRVYLDTDGDPNVEVTVRLHDGVSQSYIASELDWFMTSLEKFKSHLGGRVE